MLLSAPRRPSRGDHHRALASKGRWADQGEASGAGLARELEPVGAEPVAEGHRRAGPQTSTDRNPEMIPIGIRRNRQCDCVVSL
jgi:hypothetical protein